ncbi:MAG TPA: prepilin-type N-terminal cleavage/methylation domain-containing protein [Planctomycetota bacterium]
MKRQAGFTIIEMLIVAAILAMLAGILVPVLEDAAASARDARRAADLKAVQASLEAYRRVNGTFPIQSTLAGDYTAGKTYNTGAATDYIPGLVPTYMQSLPKDPDSRYPDATNGWGYAYISDATGDNYKFIALGTPDNFPTGNPFADPARAATSWAVYTPGAVAF